MFKEYFKELEEESIRDNFVTVYELMDEVMDFGFPQTTDSKILQEWDKYAAFLMIMWKLNAKFCQSVWPHVLNEITLCRFSIIAALLPDF